MDLHSGPIGTSVLGLDLQIHVLRNLVRPGGGGPYFSVGALSS